MKLQKVAAGALALALLLTACGPSAGPAPIPTPTDPPAATPMPDEAVFAELMAEVEARNRGIDAPVEDLDRFKYDFEGGGPLLTGEEWGMLGSEEAPDTLTVADARAEVDYLFRLLRTRYGLYTWFGGDETFGAAEERALSALEGREEIPTWEYRNLLLASLDFLNDGHFTLEGRRMGEHQPLFCNEDLLFDRRDGAFYLEDRRLKAVDGEDPAAYLKRAIGPEGELTWKLYAPGRGVVEHTVTLTFDDGAELVGLPPVRDTEYTIGTGSTPFLMVEQDGALIIQMDEMTFGPGDGVSDKLMGDGAAEADFVASAEAAQDHAVAVVNLTRNHGGNGDLPLRWFRAFMGEEPQPNYATLGLNPFGWEPRTGEVQEGDYRVRRPSPQYLEREDGPFLVVLTSGDTASAAEGFTDLVHNLGRTLVIGSNTGGCLTGSQTWFDMRLPWSGLTMAWGADLFYWPQDYFQEGVGLEPDIYLTGGNQGIRLAQFMARYLPVE